MLAIPPPMHVLFWPLFLHKLCISTRSTIKWVFILTRSYLYYSHSKLDPREKFYIYFLEIVVSYRNCGAKDEFLKIEIGGVVNKIPFFLWICKLAKLTEETLLVSLERYVRLKAIRFFLWKILVSCKTRFLCCSIWLPLRACNRLQLKTRLFRLPLNVPAASKAL